MHMPRFQPAPNLNQPHVALCAEVVLELVE
jgi:hypothetical protein